VEVTAANKEDFRVWDGWVHSRMRYLVGGIEEYVKVRPWPIAANPPTPEGEEDKPCAYHFLGEVGDC
jgi:hypothetical protein